MHLKIIIFSVDNPKGDFFLSAAEAAEALHLQASAMMESEPELVETIHKKLHQFTSKKGRNYLHRYVHRDVRLFHKFWIFDISNFLLIAVWLTDSAIQ